MSISDRTKEVGDLPKAIQLGNIIHLLKVLTSVMTERD